ncbi:baseplate J/gp47 family protein [Entomobacter blattae]|uniref:Baseplate J-like protein n=1 Tax=Entomobacter blattae TaxID=2762277 RepID=A0A7H1NR82_9PROT|nr:baseplate J/gp47 family protein [Entomobacter blattae]QNT78292.1 Baseplate J-like protein [Entomobacter blattae]
MSPLVNSDLVNSDLVNSDEQVVNSEQARAIAAVSPTTSVPAPRFTRQGLVIPTEAELLAGVIADINGAFGNTLSFFDQSNRFLLSRPQGQIATTQTAILNDAYGLLQYYVNQIDPTVAEGKMQDAIGKIYFLYRKPALATRVVCLCRGAAGTVIPQGAKARDHAGNVYRATQSGTISVATSTVEIEFAAEELGPLECPAGTLTQIYQIIPGWDSIINQQEGIIGQNVESRAQFEARRRESSAHNALNTVSSLVGTLRQVEGVRDAYVVDNPSALPVVKGGVTLKPHSLYICVSGGKDSAIAQAIWQKKPPGCDMTGNTNVTIVDDQNGYAPPLPQYSITFQRALPVRIAIRVEMAVSSSHPDSAEELIKAAVYNNFNGIDGSEHLRIGSVIYGSRFYAAIQALGVWANISLVGVARDGGDFSVSVSTDITEYPTLSMDDIEVIFP